MLKIGGDIMDIGGKIKMLRQANGLTLEELANRSELTKGFLSQLERDLTSTFNNNFRRYFRSFRNKFAGIFSENQQNKLF